MSRLRRHHLPLLLFVTVLLAAGLVAAQDAPAPDGLPIQFRGAIETVVDGTITIKGRDIDISGMPLLTTLQPGMIVEITAILTPDNRVVAQTVLIFAGGAALVPAVATPDALPDFVCPRSAGDWLEHPDDWSVNTLMLGMQAYRKDDLLALLNTPAGDDVSVLLAYEIIAAKLNVASGVDVEPVARNVIAADSLLALFQGRLPYRVLSDTEPGRAMQTLIDSLKLFNNSVIFPECPGGAARAPASTPEVSAGALVTVQGQVQGIRDNVITMLGASVWFDPSDPVLPTLRVGDTIQIEGFVGQGQLASVLVAVKTTVLTPEAGAVPQQIPPPAATQEISALPAPVATPEVRDDNSGRGRGRGGDDDDDSGRGRGRGSDDDDD